MALCGFNQNMLDGMKGFHKGLVEHGIVDRAKLKNKTTKEIIENELKDMDAFLKETHNLKNREIRELIENLARYSKTFYELVDKLGLENYLKIIKSLNKIYFEMDRKYYDELEGKEDAMKKLVNHLNKMEVK